MLYCTVVVRLSSRTLFAVVKGLQYLTLGPNGRGAAAAATGSTSFNLRIIRTYNCTISPALVPRVLQFVLRVKTRVQLVASIIHRV